jgi:hypothetical protein
MEMIKLIADQAIKDELLVRDLLKMKDSVSVTFAVSTVDTSSSDIKKQPPLPAGYKVVHQQWFRDCIGVVK